MPLSAGLSNLYREIEAGTVELITAPEPKNDNLPHALGVYFGAQAGWSPDREGGSKLAVEWACDLATRETLIVELCPMGLSGLGDLRLGSGETGVASVLIRSSHRPAHLVGSLPRRREITTRAFWT